jgi:hypothetical protein
MTTVVVGHGRSPEGKCWGSRIDNCKTVVRMWDWEWQDPIDCGVKYDYGLFTMTPTGLRVFMEHNKRTPSRGWLAYFGKPTMLSGLLPNGKPVEVVDPAPWWRWAREMGGAGLSGRLTLTRGCVAAAWAIAHEPRHVVLVGFDNVACGINQPIELSFNPVYWKLYNSRNNRAAGKMEKVYPIGTAQTETHDMAVELPLLRKLAELRKVELLFATDVWR